MLVLAWLDGLSEPVMAGLVPAIHVFLSASL
jgi:hypothetical protein